MSKRAEEKAREAYPYDGGTKGWLCKSSRPIFIKGYEQAEKDLALTWQDIKRIVKIADDLEPLRSGEDFLFELQSEEGFYKEVLKRFKEAKKCG